MMAALAAHLESSGRAAGDRHAQLLQGPFSDAMTGAGELAMLRQLGGAPVPPENFIVADVSSAWLGPNEPTTRSSGPTTPEWLSNYSGVVADDSGVVR